MSYLNSLFQQISTSINRPISDFEAFIKILQQNWFDTQQAVRQITNEQFDSMKIPKRIVTKIREFTSGGGQKQKQKEMEREREKDQFRGMVKQQSPNNWSQPNYPPPTSHVQDFNKLYKQQIACEDTVRSFIFQLQHQTTSNKTKMIDCVKLLLRILQNIISDPQNEKFRIMKLTSNALQNNIVCYQSCMHFIEYIGFIRTDQEIVILEPDIVRLKGVRRNLENQLETVQQMYDPYQASFNSSSMMPNMINETEKDDKNYNDMLDKLIEYRKEKMSHPPTDRRVRIYHKKHDIKEVEMDFTTLEEKFLTSDDPIFKQYFQSLSSHNSESSKFRNKRKIEFELLSKQPIYQEALIRIKLPNEYILSGVFGPYETIEKVIQFAQQYIQGDVYIFNTPPVVYMNKHREKSLVEMDCVPNGIFFLGVEGPWQVRPEYVQFIQS